jgi:dihydroorotase
MFAKSKSQRWSKWKMGTRLLATCTRNNGRKSLKLPLLVNIVDVEKGRIEKASVIQTERGLRLEKYEGLHEPEVYLSPGWIDLHAHIFHGFTSLGVDPDRVGLCRGVHLIADAGSAGEATLPGMISYLVPSKKTLLRAWLNISSIGLVHLREYSDMRQVNVQATVQAIAQNRPFVCGIKVRCSGIIVEDKGVQPLVLAAEASRKAKVPMMVHVGETPPEYEEFLDYLGPGDVISHCFHGKKKSLWEESGHPIHALRRALERGVILDVAHGAASFDHQVARRAIASGYRNFVISTDLHVRNVQGPVYDLPTTMTKLMDCGLTLPEVIAAVTKKPADILGLEGWCQLGPAIQRATFFKTRPYDREKDVRFFDSNAQRMNPQWVIEPVMITVNGVNVSL